MIPIFTRKTKNVFANPMSCIRPDHHCHYQLKGVVLILNFLAFKNYDASFLRKKDQCQNFSPIRYYSNISLISPYVYIYTYIFIYLLTAIGLSPGGSTHLHTNNT
jgi:hypothetical protein